MNHDRYIYIVKKPGHDATIRRFSKDPIEPTKVKTLDNGDILYRVEKSLLEGEEDGR